MTNDRVKSMIISFYLDVFTFCGLETPLRIVLSSHKLIEYHGCLRSAKVFLLVPELALHERFVKLCKLNIIRYICCGN
ncbi:hypothetical protein CY35_01G141200 [Sphagnum magellanicum]|nr:hypothetical protein CY35_01G141200 [Sphagnum magellanicum]KAH9576015.1 hypothetical protein CY35_01G141200 [Sphagnum magellanicum]